MLKSIDLPSVPLLPQSVTSPGASVEAGFPELLQSLLSEPDLDAFLGRSPGLEQRLVARARDVACRAYPSGKTTGRQSDSWIDHPARAGLHRALLVLYRQHMGLSGDPSLANQFHPLACTLTREMEKHWERDMLQRVHARHELTDASLPAEPEAFAEWYRDTAFSHPLYEHDLYSFVACDATREQLEWFFRMECAGEAAFDDLLALAQVGTRGEVKMEMATNYWDEMGKGHDHAVHTHLFHRLIEGLDLVAPDAFQLPWQVLAGVNVMMWSCIPRRNAFRAQGTLGAVELLAPQRCTRLVHGALRLGIRKNTMIYYGAHAIIDIGHAEGWLSHVIVPQVRENPGSRLGIAEGLLVRADASLDYFDYCLAHARSMAA